MIKFAKFAVAAGSLAVATSVAFAAGDALKERQELMKTVGKTTKASAQMAKGVTPFDAAKAQEVMQTLIDVPDKYVTMFPEGSDKGETEASPKIWEDMDGFKAAAEKLKVAATNGLEAAKKGEDAFKAAFGELVKTCKGCHQDYRIKKQ